MLKILFLNFPSGGRSPESGEPQSEILLSFKDETGLLGGVGEMRCLTFGSPPALHFQTILSKKLWNKPLVYKMPHNN